MTSEPELMIQLLEGAMLTAFFVSWYRSIWKMLATGKATGKSLGFVLLICSGYVTRLIAADGLPGLGEHEGGVPVLFQ